MFSVENSEALANLPQYGQYFLVSMKIKNIEIKSKQKYELENQGTQWTSNFKSHDSWSSNPPPQLNHKSFTTEIIVNIPQAQFSRGKNTFTFSESQNGCLTSQLRALNTCALCVDWLYVC